MAAALALLLGSPGGEVAAGTGRPRSAPEAKDPAPRILPAGRVRFEPNVGQTDPAVRWIARAPGITAFLADGEAVLALGGPADPEGARRRFGHERRNADSPPGGVLRMAYVGARPSPRIDAGERIPGVSHHFKGNDPARWRRDVPHHAGATYRDLWPGIDLVFRGNPARLEYDLLVAPGADLGRARFRMEGAAEVVVDASGDLVCRLAAGEVRQRAPRLWQDAPGGARRPVEGAFRVHADGTVGFTARDVDPGLPLVVDPVIDWATYLGGSGGDASEDAALAGDGDVLVVGRTGSTDFPRTAPYQAGYAGGTGNYPADVFLTRYDADGSVVFSTYLGGTGSEYGFGVAVDPSGDAILVGITTSTDFPLASAIQSVNGGGNNDAFVARLSADGSTLGFSTYLGGIGFDEAHDVVADLSGWYVAGLTTAGFPEQSPLQTGYAGGGADAVLFKIDRTSQTFVWSTMYGGLGQEVAYGIAVDGTGACYAAGITDSSDFPVRSAFQNSLGNVTTGAGWDAFCMKVNAAGTATVYATFYGGSGNELCYQVALTSLNEAVLAGHTTSTNLPLLAPVQNVLAGADDAFLCKFTASGSQLGFATLLGGVTADQTFGVGVDSGDNITFCGLTNSPDFPTINAFQTTYIGGGTPFSDDAWVAKFSGNGTTVYFSSYLASAGFDDPTGLVIDSSGNTIIVGITSDPNYPVTAAQQSTYGGGAHDTYVVRLKLVPPAAPTGLLALAMGSQVQLTWTDASNNETGFEIERKTGAGSFARIHVANAGAMSHIDQAVVASTTYTYRVRAANGDGGSAWSNESTTTTPAPVTVPTAPNGLTATVLSSTSVRLDWTDRSSNETVFEIQRRPIPGAYSTTLLNKPADSVTHTDGTLLPDATVAYRVRAIGSAGVSLWAAEAKATTSPSLSLGLAKGALTDSATSAKDKVKASGTLSFLPASPDGALDPVGDGVTVHVGNEDQPMSLVVPPDDPGWKVKGTKATWKSPKTSSVKVTIALDTVKGTFLVSISKFNFPAPPTGPIRVSLRCGADGGSSRAAWTEKKPGVLKYP